MQIFHYKLYQHDNLSEKLKWKKVFFECLLIKKFFKIKTIPDFNVNMDIWNPIYLDTCMSMLKTKE